MTREELARYAARLEETGLRLGARKTDGSGNVRRIEELPWSQALPIIVARLGWTVVEDEAEPAEVTPLRVVD